MAKNYDATGKTKTGVLEMTKGFQTLMIKTDKQFGDLTSEKIKIAIERQSGNVECTKGFVSLVDLALIAAYGKPAIATDGDGNMVILIDIAQGGYAPLQDKEKITVELDGLNPANTYKVFSIEGKIPSYHLLDVERKSMNSDDYDKDFYVGEFLLASLEVSAKISEVILHYSTGVRTTHSLEELQALQLMDDPVYFIDKGGAAMTIPATRVLIPLTGIDKIQVRKETGSPLNLVVRRF